MERELIGWSWQEIQLHLEDEYRSKTGVFEEMKYRITTTDGQILGHRASRLGASALAEHQFTQLGEPIAIKSLKDGEYVQIAQIDWCACLPGQECSFHNIEKKEV